LEEGLYPSGKLLELSSNVPDAAIYFTLDGSTPTKLSALYVGPIKMTDNFTLRAVAIHPDYVDSDILTREYKVTGLSVDEVFPSVQDGSVSDIHLPYIAYSKELYSQIKESLISFTIDGKKGEFIPSIVKNKLYIIPKDMDTYRGNHTCSIHIEPYAITSIDGDPTLSVDYNWNLSASDEYYSILPVSIYASSYASAYLSANGVLTTWGGWPNERGWSYNKTFSFRNVKSSCVGQSIFAYIDNENNLWVAGYDTWWFSPYQEYPILYETNVIDVAYASEATLFYVKENGDLYGIGSDRFNQLMGKGNKKSYDTYYADTPIKLMEDVKSVVSRDRNCAVIKKDGSLWMWGEYDFFDHLKLTSPKKISDNVKHVSIGYSEPVTFVKNDNTGWYVDDKTLAIKKIGENIAYVEGAKERGFYITTDNKLYGWGYNNRGQIGNGTITSYPYPLPENAEFIMDDVKQVSCNGGYALALTTNGDVYGWGDNDFWRFDRNKSTDYNQITPLLLFSPVINSNIGNLIVPDEFTVPLNGYYYIPIKTEPGNGVFSEIKWVSSDENIASIDDNGILFAKSEGECEIQIIAQPFEGASIEKIIRVKVEQDSNVGITKIAMDEKDCPVEIFNIQGLRILYDASIEDINNLPYGIYIKRQGGNSEKIIIK